MAERQKAKAVQRLGEMSACILSGEPGGLSWPPEYLVVDGKARLSSNMDDVIDVAAKIVPIMTGKPLPEEALPGVRKVMEQEKRVVIRITPESTFHSPSVHNVEDADPDSEKPLHGLGARLRWREA